MNIQEMQAFARGFLVLRATEKIFEVEDRQLNEAQRVTLLMMEMIDQGKFAAAQEAVSAYVLPEGPWADAQRLLNELTSSNS